MKEIKVYWTSWGRVRTVAMRSWTIAFVSRYDHLAAVKELKDEVEVKRLVIEAAIEENQSLTSKLQKAVEALNFYAAQDNYSAYQNFKEQKNVIVLTEESVSDIARATLKEIGVES